MPLTPAERRLRASIAGRTGWINTKDRKARAKHASNGLYEKFYREADPDGVMSETDRRKAAESLYKRHFQRMKFNSMKARRLRKEQREHQAQAMREARAAEQLDGGAA